MSNVVSAVDQLRQTIGTPRLEGNVGLNVICILVNTDMMGCGNVTKDPAAQRDRAMLRVIEYFAKSFKITQASFKMTSLSRASISPY